MSTPGLVLGVDGGGTSTIAWLADRDGRVLGHARAGPSNAKAVGVGAAKQALDAAVLGAFQDAGREPTPAEVACLGVAGFDRPDDRALLAEWSASAGWAKRLVQVNDGDLVVAAGTPDGWGAGVIAGTGSIAVGRDRDGRKARAGGWGHLIGDEGSAYAVVLAALNLVARRADGRERASDDNELARALCEALGVAAPSAIVSILYAPGFDRTKIAGLAPVVLASAELDPEITPRILQPAGVALAEQVLAVCRSLNWPPGPLPLALAGSFLLGATAVSTALIARLTAAGYEPAPAAVSDPVRGAVAIALRSLAD